MPRSLALPVAALLACSIRELPADSATDGTDSTSTTTAASITTTTTDSPSPTTTTALTTTSAATGVDDTGQSFVTPEDIPGSNDCDGWIMPIQDCPEGQKCTLEGWLNDTQCVDIVDDPKQLGEPCQILEVEGSFSGHDDCDAGLLCWEVDPDTGIGRCLELCHGPIDSPSCPLTNGGCVICQDCAVGLCLPGCDPLLQGCPNGDLCVPNPMDPNGFICVIDASGEEGQVFDICEYANACDAGLICANPTLAEECDQLAAGCCLPFCDLSVMPPPCPGAGQQCLPWYDQGTAPPGLENVGVCGLPQ